MQERAVIGHDQLVPLLDGRQVPYLNLDNAASTPVHRSVMAKIEEFMPWYASVHRGAGLKSRVATAAYEQARDIVRDFVGGHHGEHTVIFGKNSTEAINQLAWRLGLKRSDVVLIGDFEHHSNDLPWRRQATVKRIALLDDGQLDIDDYRRLLKRYVGQIRLVSVSGASNVTGVMVDLHLMARLAHAAGAQFAVDAAQLAPHRPINIGRLADPEHIDYLAMSAHKMYAPFGSGALIGRADTFAIGQPAFCGGGTIKAVTAKTVDWADGPDRDEAGSPNVVGAIALAAAIKVMQQIGLAQLAAHERQLTAYALKQLSGLSGVQVYGPIDENVERTAVIPFNVIGKPHALVAAILSYESGIGVRNGCFCAHPYLYRLLKMSSAEQIKARQAVIGGDKRQAPGMVRVSLAMYNTSADIDRLMAALKAIINGQHAKYHQRTNGEFFPSGWRHHETDFFDINRVAGGSNNSGTMNR